MAQRISRAKQRIKTSGVPFRMPTRGERAERLGAVLHVLYLIFNEGYASSIGPTLQRSDLADRGDPADPRRAIACCRTTREVAGLLALMLLTDARRAARTGPDGELIPLAEAGSHALGSRGDRGGHRARSPRRCRKGSVGAYQLQAAIAARARRSGARRGHRLAADPRAVRPADADVRQPDGRRSTTRSPPRWSTAPRRPGAARGARRGRAPRRPLPARRRPRASARDGRRSPRGDRALPGGGRTDRERAGARTT